MENGGDDGSVGGHFEKKIFGNEVMVSDTNFDSIFSQMSLAVAADSNWYDVDLYSGENYEYGRNERCRIFSSKCLSNIITEFCNLKFLGKKGCSKNMKYINMCQKSQFNKNCGIYLNYESCDLNRKKMDQEFVQENKSICQNIEVNIKIIIN